MAQERLVCLPAVLEPGCLCSDPRLWFPCTSSKPRAAQPSQPRACMLPSNQSPFLSDVIWTGPGYVDTMAARATIPSVQHAFRVPLGLATTIDSGCAGASRGHLCEPVNPSIARPAHAADCLDWTGLDCAARTRQPNASQTRRLSLIPTGCAAHACLTQVYKTRAASWF
jgi:hypothetical protein